MVPSTDSEYVRQALTAPGFRPLLGFPKLDVEYVAERLFPFFAQRVMDTRRPDFRAFLIAIDLPPTATQLDVLARTAGGRMGDKIQVAREPLVQPTGATSYKFLVRGIRHSPRPHDETEAALASLTSSTSLQLLPEPSNPVNPRAMLVATKDGIAIGWVPDMLLDYVHTVATFSTVDVRVARVNGPEVPAHLRLVVRLEGQAPPGYELFSGPQWQPISGREGLVSQ